MTVQHYFTSNYSGEPLKFNGFKEDEKGSINVDTDVPYPEQNVAHTLKTEYENGLTNDLKVVFTDNGNCSGCRRGR